MSIPKVIHYCWFGTNKKPELVQKCIESWKIYLPDYEIREWNDNDLKNCDIKYVQEAIQEKKWAFVSDYFRLYALYTEGGIYFDSDNEVFKSFDEFLELDFFTGYEEYKGVTSPFTAVVAAKKKNHIIKDLLDEYENISIYNEFGEIDLTTNTKRVERYFQKNYKLKKPYDHRKPLYIEDKAVIYPDNYFCSYDADTSYAVHHFNGSWVPDLLGYKRRYFFKNLYLKIYTISKGCFIKQIKNIKEIPIFAYPRYSKRTIVLSIGRKISEN